MTKRVDVETLEQWAPKPGHRLTERAPEQIAYNETLYQCFAYVADNPAASQRLLRLRDEEKSWATCLQVLQREFPDLGYHFPAPKVAAEPPTV